MMPPVQAWGIQDPVQWAPMIVGIEMHEAIVERDEQAGETGQDRRQ